MKSSLILFVVSMLLGTHGVARAQSPTAASPAPAEARSPNVVEAERRFNEAVAHMDQKRYDAACPLLKQSHALDPSSGTLLNLGDCYEQLGLTASAYRAWPRFVCENSRRCCAA
jgi:tetratricopeptide (TPR) repeat protein